MAAWRVGTRVDLALREVTCNERSTYAVSVGDAVDAEIQAVLVAFQEMLNRKWGNDELLALEIRKIDVRTTRYPGGLLHTTTEVIAKRSSNDLVKFNKYQLAVAAPHRWDRHQE